MSDECLFEEAHSLASRLAEGPAIAMGLTKKLTNRTILADINDTLELEGLAQGMCFETEDFKEGVQALKNVNHSLSKLLRKEGIVWRKTYWIHYGTN